MFTPKYKTSIKLITNITEIARLYGQLEGIQIPASLLLNLERDNLIQSSFSSNRIEGNPLSHTDVTNLLLGDRVPANRAEKEVSNYFGILKRLELLENTPLSVPVLLELHAELMEGVNNTIKGKIRDAEVIVGRRNESGELIIKHNPPAHNPQKITELLNELIKWLGSEEHLPLIKAGIFHHQFVFIHPFEDGNGRICRLATALYLIQNSYRINKYFVLDDYYDIDRNLYSDKLHSADKGDSTEWLEYFTDGVRNSLQSVLAKLDNGLSKLSFDLRPSKKELEVIDIIKRDKELTSIDLAAQLGVSRQQAFNLLKSLVEKGLLEQIGEKRATYYRLK
jgi:Fic family protein